MTRPDARTVLSLEEDTMRWMRWIGAVVVIAALMWARHGWSRANRLEAHRIEERLAEWVAL